MERLAEITSATAETPNEKWFQDTYAKLIQDALKRLREPNNPANPQASWQLFKQVDNKLTFITYTASTILCLKVFEEV